MATIAQAQEPSRFTQEFEDYRRACKEKHEQHQSSASTTSKQVAVAMSPISEYAGASSSAASPMLPSVAASISPSDTLSPDVLRRTTPAPEGTEISVSDSPILNRSVDSLKKPKRRNSLSKVISSISGVFSKKPDSPDIAREKAKLKAEKAKKEQDFRMAALIAQLEMDGHSDADIQMHLFRLRDQAQFASPKMNSPGDLFRSIGQAFKEEFTTRRNSAVHVSEVNPFLIAGANYHSDLGLTYEDLVALESVPRGVKSVEHLPTLVYEGQELPSSQTTCAVCMQDFEHSEELRSLHCTHHFHKECIDKWLGVGTTCPVCKCEVESDC